MKLKKRKSRSEIAKEHNEDILARLNAGQDLRAFDADQSWFPPRPVIEKDENAISKVYSSIRERKKAKREKPQHKLQIVS